MKFLLALFKGDGTAERVVPPTGFTAAMTVASSAAMAFLAVFALTLTLAAGRLANRWEAELDQTATIRLSAPADQIEASADAVEVILSQTPGIQSFRRLDESEQQELLAPWFGKNLSLDTLRLPVLFDVTLDKDRPDGEGLQNRLGAEAPGAIYDDHGKWREALVASAGRLKSLALMSLALIAAVTATMIALAASAAIAANGQVIDVLRLVGARDTFITRAFVRRFTTRALIGAAIGTVIAMVLVAALPAPDEVAFMSGLGLSGFEWLWPFVVPPLAALLAFFATRLAAARRLKKVS